MKFLLLFLIITFTASLLIGNPIVELDKWTEEQKSEFNSNDVVNFLNGNRTDGDITYGSEYEFNSADTRFCSATTLDATHFVIAYQDRGNSYYGTAIVGTVSGSTITYGSEYVFNAVATEHCSATTLDTTHFVVAYRDTGGSLYFGTAIVGTVSGSTIAFGSEYVFNSASTTYISATALDATHFAVAYEDQSSGDGISIVGTVSGSTITYGTENEFNDQASYISTTTLDANHYVIAFLDFDNYYGTAVVGTVSGSTITYGSEVVFNSSTTYNPSIISLDATHFVVAYPDFGNSEYGTAIVGTVSGSTITFGSEYVFSSAQTSRLSASALDTTHFVVAYMVSPYPYDLVAIVGAVSGSTISYGSGFVFNISYSDATSVTSIDASHFVVAYLDYPPYSGNSIVGEVEGTSPPAVPVNIEIEIIGNDVVITWDVVIGASSYKVYSSNEPYENFSEDLSGSFVDESWSAPIEDVKKFYYVIASTETVRSKKAGSQNTYQPKRKSINSDSKKYNRK